MKRNILKKLGNKLENSSSYVPTDILVLCKLVSQSDIHINSRELENSYIKLTPLSYKFFEPKKTYQNHKIIIYFKYLNRQLNNNILNKTDSKKNKLHFLYYNYSKYMFIIRPSVKETLNGVLIKAYDEKSFVLLKINKLDETSDRTFTPIPIFNKKTHYHQYIQKQILNRH